MTLPQPIRATILAVLLLLTLGAHLACQARTTQPTMAGRNSGAWTPRAPIVQDQTVTAPASPAPVVDPIGQTNLQATDDGLVSMVSRIDRNAVLQGRDGIVHVEVTLRSASTPSAGPRRAVDMVVILDRSGSMEGSKISYAKTALTQLIQRLQPEDRLGIVAYESTGLVLVPIQTATRNAKLAWLDLVERIGAHGSTNMSEGMDLAQDMLERAKQPGRNARVLLLSDGLANVGDSSLSGLTRRARRAISGEYAISTMGIGADFDERLMTQLATAGDGAFYYLAKLEVLATFFEAEFATASTTVATRSRLRVHLAPGARLVDAMGLPHESVGDAVEIPIGSLYANHERTIWLTVQVPTNYLGATALGRVTFDYRRADGNSEGRSVDLPKVACVNNWDDYKNGINKTVWERAVVDSELAQSEERLGDAIASGSAVDVDREVARARDHQQLAQALGSPKVASALQHLDSSAASAKAAQSAPAPARNMAAKRQKAEGYNRVNSAKYRFADPAMGY